MLKGAVAITELTLGIGKNAFFEGLYVKGIDTINDIFRFDAVRTDVLYRRGSYFIRNEAQFFQTAISHIGQLGNHIIESQAVLGFNRLIVQELRPRHTGMQNYSVEIGGK